MTLMRDGVEDSRGLLLVALHDASGPDADNVFSATCPRLRAGSLSNIVLSGAGGPALHCGMSDEQPTHLLPLGLALQDMGIPAGHVRTRAIARAMDGLDLRPWCAFLLARLALSRPEPQGGDSTLSLLALMDELRQRESKKQWTNNQVLANVWTDLCATGLSPADASLEADQANDDERQTSRGVSGSGSRKTSPRL